MDNHDAKRLDDNSQEIDLVDLGVLFWRHRKVIMVVFLGLIVLTIVGAAIKQPTYAYSTSIKLGSQANSTGEQVPLITSQAAQQMLKGNYVPLATAEYAARHSDELAQIRTVQIDVSGQNGDNAVQLSCKAHPSQADLCIEIEQLAARAFIDGNSNVVMIAKANLGAQLADAQLTLSSLENPDVFGVNKLAAEHAIASAQSTLKKLQDELLVLNVRKAKLATSQKLYENNVSQLKQHVVEVSKATIDAAKGSADPTNAMANLLLSTEEQRSVNLINELEQKLNVNLPEQFAKTQVDIDDNLRNQKLQKQAIQQNETALKKLEFAHQQSISSQQQTIKKIQAQIDNIEATSVLGEGLKSLNPVGLGRVAILGLGVIVSGLASLLAAFFVGFIGQVRDRLSKSAKYT